MIREMSLATAEGMGLDRMDSLLPYHPVSTTAEERRRAIAALLRIGGDSFTLSAVNDTLSGCGISARAIEGTSPGCVEVTFPDTPGEPADFERLRPIIEEILPCHLDISYRFRYNTWGELMELVDSWGEAIQTDMTWGQLASRIA